jgi:hypothetical protein
MRPQLPEDDIAQIQSITDRLRRLEQGEGTLTGAIMLWRSGTPVPSGWLLCNGTTFSATLYPALAALWGTTTLPANPGLTGYIAIVRAR